MGNIEAINIVMAFVVSVITVATPVAVLLMKHSKIEVKVDTIWDYIMRRAIAAGLETNNLTMNSPVMATPGLEAMLEPMKEDLWQYYKAGAYKLSTRELFIALEKDFGDRFMKEICIPNGITQGVCTLAAIDVLKKKTNFDRTA